MCDVKNYCISQTNKFQIFSSNGGLGTPARPVQKKKNVISQSSTIHVLSDWKEKQTSLVLTLLIGIHFQFSKATDWSTANTKANIWFCDWRPSAVLFFPLWTEKKKRPKEKRNLLIIKMTFSFIYKSFIFRM